MDLDVFDDTVVSIDDESDAYSPDDMVCFLGRAHPPPCADRPPQPAKPKPKARAAPKAKAAPKLKAPAKPKAAPKKLTQTTLSSKSTGKKRAKPESDEDEDDGGSDDDVSGFSNTPPSAKKQKKSTGASKKSSGKPLEEIENDSMQLDLPEPGPAGSKKTAEETYQKLTHLQHIIKRPDTYIGSVEMCESQMWTVNKESKQMELRKIHYVPGLYKIFDEILVNAADNKQRDSSDHGVMTALKVNINRAAGEISVENNGKGIPVVIHGVSPPAPAASMAAN